MSSSVIGAVNTAASKTDRNRSVECGKAKGQRDWGRVRSQGEVLRVLGGKKSSCGVFFQTQWEAPENVKQSGFDYLMHNDRSAESRLVEGGGGDSENEDAVLCINSGSK